LPIPAFLRDLGAEPAALRILIVAAASLGAAGLNPPVASPSLPSVQSIIRAQPEVYALILLGTLIAGGMLFVGGVLGDANGRRGILLGALGMLCASSLLSLLVPSGPLFIASRLAGGAAAYAVLPFALALVATAYQGLIRATAIGIVYAVYGGATAASPALLTLLGPTGPSWPAFLVASLAAAFAVWFAWSRTPNLSASARSDRSYVVATAVWAFAIVIICSAAVGLGNRQIDIIRIGLVVVGLAMIGGYVAWDRRRRARSQLRRNRVLRRPVTVAVAVGLVIGFAQAAPMFQLSLFFDLILRYGAFGATLATAPFLLATVAAGPVAGAMLKRFGPRSLVAGGVAAIGLGNILAAAVLDQQVLYVALVLPLVLIGAGFVVATTVRTAIIFASVSHGLPATAAALNEASVLVGSRIGLAALTVLITQHALDIYGASLPGTDPVQNAAAVAAFRDALVAINTPGLSQLVASLTPADVGAYVSAFVEAYRQSLFGTGLLALVWAPIAWFALGVRDPLTTVWDHLDERAEPATPTPG
jgi:DHA2 family multidrug resistance protein-like MFS transporter